MATRSGRLQQRALGRWHEGGLTAFECFEQKSWARGPGVDLLAGDVGQAAAVSEIRRSAAAKRPSRGSWP